MNEQPTPDHDLLIRLETKLDSFINAQLDHETRMRTLEAEREQFVGSIRTMKGVIAFIGFIATSAIALGGWSIIIGR